MATKLKSLLRYIKISITLLKHSYIKDMQYRLFFSVRLIRIAIEISLMFLFVNSFYYQTDQIAGWDQPSLLLVYAVYTITSGIAFTYLGNDPYALPQKILNGDLDYTITKPINNFFLVFGQTMAWSQIFRILSSIVIIFYALAQTDPPLALWSTFLFFLTSSAAILFQISLVTFISTLSFWTFSNELVHLSTTVTSTGRLPVSIFKKPIVLLLTIIPVAFLATIPVQALLEKISALTYLSLPIAFLSIFASNLFFNLALRHYSSASS